MSMHEALRKFGVDLPWLKAPETPPEPPKPQTPVEAAEILLRLAQAPGNIDRESGTWHGVARWAATELIAAHAGLEIARDERATMLRARIQTLRDLLLMDERERTDVFRDDGPYVP